MQIVEKKGQIQCLFWLKIISVSTVQYVEKSHLLRKSMIVVVENLTSIFNDELI